ncbi:MAG TPA: hypothetical protein VI282_00680 [Verrucomicrobiae bacterium]
MGGVVRKVGFTQVNEFEVVVGAQIVGPALGVWSQLARGRMLGTPEALGIRMDTPVNVNQSKIAKIVVYLLVLVALALATSFARAGEDRPSRAAVTHSVQVKTVAGVAEYAYDSTGWRPLSAGKILQAGATIRTGTGASVVLAMEEQGSLLRVGPMRRLELAAAAPSHETSVTIVPLQARVIKAKVDATELAAQ